MVGCDKILNSISYNIRYSQFICPVRSRFHGSGTCSSTFLNELNINRMKISLIRPTCLEPLFESKILGIKYQKWTKKKSRKNVREACAALFFIIFLQTIAYQILWDMKFLARNLALCGAVCLLLAEVTGETRTIFAGVPTLDDNNPKNMLQLSGTVKFVLPIWYRLYLEWDFDKPDSSIWLYIWLWSPMRNTYYPVEWTTILLTIVTILAFMFLIFLGNIWAVIDVTLKFSGRILLILMFMTLLHFTMSLKDLVVNLVGLSMMGLVAVGYKTKLVSLVMVCWLLALNCLMNDFWRHRSTSIMWDFKKYDFFQVNRPFIVTSRPRFRNHKQYFYHRARTIVWQNVVRSRTISPNNHSHNKFLFQALTVCGGLLLLTAFGPGGVSIDERKKLY